MAKKDKPEVQEQTEQKVQTRYDRKMEERRIQKEKDVRQAKLHKITAAVVGIVLAAAIVVWAGVSIVNKQTALHGTYAKIGEHELTRLEYDYYYNSTVNSYLTAYSSILPYMGLDTSADFDSQIYMDNLTWKDMFDEMTVEQIRQMKALADDAAKNGFAYDGLEADYESFVSGIEAAAEAAGTTVGKYYQSICGDYATLKNTEEFVKGNMTADAYYNKLLADQAPSDEEIASYYQENRQSYDKVDYRSFTFTAELGEEPDDEEISKAMEELKQKAEAMLAEREEGGDFEELCVSYASGEQKANYEDAESEYSLTEGNVYAAVNPVMAQWLYDDARTEGDRAVLEDESDHQYYVVEFISRYYDEVDNTTISNTLASQRVAEYIAELTENYQITDVKGDLKYLTAEKETETETDEAQE